MKKQMIFVFFVCSLLACRSRVDGGGGQEQTEYLVSWISIPVRETPIVGVEITYDMPSVEDYWKGIFVKDRKVRLSPYSLSQYEVTYELWYKVRMWAIDKGYVFTHPGWEGSLVQNGGRHQQKKKHTL